MIRSCIRAPINISVPINTRVHPKYPRLNRNLLFFCIKKYFELQSNQKSPTFQSKKNAKFIPAMFHFPFHFFHGIFGITAGGVCLILYFLPTIVAALRSHPGTGGIFAVNFFFGWPFIGWIICLVWAASGSSHYNEIWRASCRGRVEVS